MGFTQPAIAAGDAGVHALFVALGVAAAAGVIVTEARRRALWGEEMLVAVAGALLGGGLGMHAAGFLRDPGLVVQVGVWRLWQDGAKSVLGGLAGAYVGVVVAKRLIGYRVRTGDVFAPAVALGMAIGRIGCLLTEPPGRPTSLPWGVTVTPEQAAAWPGCAWCAADVPLHPSFAYEIAFQAAAFVVLLLLRDVITRPGGLLTGYLAGYAVFRFLIEFTRDNEIVLAGLTRGQLVIAAFSPLLAWRVVSLVRAERAARRDAADPDPDGARPVPLDSGPAGGHP